MTVWVVSEFGEEWGSALHEIHGSPETAKASAMGLMEEIGGDWDESVAAGILPPGTCEWSDMAGTHFVRVAPHEVMGL